MRTTITLDEDVVVIIERLRKTRNQSLKDVINDALREGLKHASSPRGERVVAPTRSVDLGHCLLDGVHAIADVLSVAERESFR
ncbi:MAG: ribbon-helix-helix protein, CopG family [Betaproteobacteria bacterium]|nr:ribbon-helix-helix protein, CopG family [Betaproteobacteria bacterium]MDE2210641.1 ribbon-helix-helix protein, CopG family [Betaproteobacteria bacterium]